MQSKSHRQKYIFPRRKKYLWSEISIGIVLRSVGAKFLSIIATLANDDCHLFTYHFYRSINFIDVKFIDFHSLLTI